MKSTDAALDQQIAEMERRIAEVEDSIVAESENSSESQCQAFEAEGLALNAFLENYSEVLSNHKLRKRPRYQITITYFEHLDAEGGFVMARRDELEEENSDMEA
jgi:hypothetical protein